MVGVTRLKVQETAAELEALLQKQSNPMLKERLQVLYLLQLPEAMSVSAVAKVIGRHRSSVQRWLSVYGDGELDRLLEVRQSRGRPRVIPEWAVTRLQKRLSQAAGFGSYLQVQQWLSATLDVDAEYATVHHLVRYRLGAKLKVARPVHLQQDPEARAAFEQTSATT
jgi:transposase